MGESKILQNVNMTPPARSLPVAVIWIMGLLALAGRLALFPYVSEDSTFFLLPWMQEFRDHGAAALGGEFSNYNFPYLFLMFLGSLLPVEPLFAIKLISMAGDLLLACSVGAVVGQLQPLRLAPETAALTALFLPTVLMNASMWGQCDSIYASFLLLALRSVVRDDARGAWLWWAVALSFKLQAVFFLPALVPIALRNRYSLGLPAIAACLWASLSVPPVLFGRSLISTFSVYFHQTQEYRLVAGAANVYAWVPNATADQGKFPAILVCGAVLLLTAAVYWRGPDSTERRVLFAITVVAICPLLLPQMHDRYFFVAEVMSLLLLRHGRLFLVPWLFAATGLAVYVLYFVSNQYAWPLMLASTVQCFAVGMLWHRLWRTQDQLSMDTAATR
jgi:Gpi18-like mannosyltransferase